MVAMPHNDRLAMSVSLVDDLPVAPKLEAEL
jgi:hypothetical protein